MKKSAVIHPAHYNEERVKCKGCGRPVECIDVVEQFNFNVGNAIKYPWRAHLKDPANEIQDLEKAREYLAFEIQRLKRVQVAKHARRRVKVRPRP